MSDASAYQRAALDSAGGLAPLRGQTMHDARLRRCGASGMCAGAIAPKFLMRDAQTRLWGLPRVSTKTEKTQGALSAPAPLLAVLRALWTRKGASHV